MSCRIKAKRNVKVGDRVSSQHFMPDGFGFGAVEDSTVWVEMPIGTKLKFEQSFQVYDGTEFDQRLVTKPPAVVTTVANGVVEIEGIRGVWLLASGTAKVIGLPA